MLPQEIQERTLVFALRIFEVVDALPATPKGKNLSNQICRAGTSVAANYRAACRAKSRADFIYKLGIVEEEADEVIFWLELIIRAQILPEPRLKPLLQEANEILAIIVASIRTAKKNRE